MTKSVNKEKIIDYCSTFLLNERNYYKGKFLRESGRLCFVLEASCFYLDEDVSFSILLVDTIVNLNSNSCFFLYDNEEVRVYQNGVTQKYDLLFSQEEMNLFKTITLKVSLYASEYNNNNMTPA